MSDYSNYPYGQQPEGADHGQSYQPSSDQFSGQNYQQPAGQSWQAPQQPYQNSQPYQPYQTYQQPQYQVPQPPVQPSYAPGAHSKIAAGLFGIFLGGFGVHNFYLGYTGKAVAQLLLTVIGWLVIVGPFVSYIWALIEGILILSSTPGSKWNVDARGVPLAE